MALDEKKKTGRTIAGIGGALGVIVVVLELFSNGLDILDRVSPLKKDNNPTEPTVIIEETQEENSENITETQNIDEETFISVTETPAERKEFYLSELDFYSTTSNYKTGIFKEIANKKDIVGNIYQHAVTFQMTGSSNSYYINKKYKNFSGTVFLPEERKDFDGKAIVEIYGDNILLYSATVENGFLPDDFSFDISEITILEIKSYAKDIWEYRECPCIGNPVLTIAQTE